MENEGNESSSPEMTASRKAKHMMMFDTSLAIVAVVLLATGICVFRERAADNLSNETSAAPSDALDGETDGPIKVGLYDVGDLVPHLGRFNILPDNDIHGKQNPQPGGADAGASETMEALFGVVVDAIRPADGSTNGGPPLSVRYVGRVIVVTGNAHIQGKVADALRKLRDANTRWPVERPR